jgi:RNA polymerase sigma-70 factor (ECF subfamily)
MHEEEASLWQCARSGDAEAFGAVFVLHHNRVYTHALRLLPLRSDAEDITASAFLELWRRRDHVRVVEDSVLPWLLVTTTNLARNVRRARRRYRAFLVRLPHETAPDTADVALSAADLGVDPQLLRALRALPWHDQVLLTLVAIEDYTLSDAAQVLGITPAAAKTRLYRIRLRVRDALPDLHPTLERLGAKP